MRPLLFLPLYAYNIVNSESLEFRCTATPDFKSKKGEYMKKLLTIVFALALGTSLSFAQAASTTPADKPADKKASTSKKKASGKKSAKKSKKASSDSTAAPK